MVLNLDVRYALAIKSGVTLRARRKTNKKLSYCWETVRRESMPRIAEMDAEMKT